jgi:hypothetical protein
MIDAASKLAAVLRTQSQWCRTLKSPLYADLLSRSALDVEAGGPCWRVFEEHAGDAPGLALALQFMGAVHRLVLENKAPELARYYPSAGGALPARESWAAFHGTVEKHGAVLRQLIEQPVQTNEVARSCALTAGFLLIARHTRLPLRLLEIGASAGLNLRWDHYWYQAGTREWGNPKSTVRFENAFSEGQPPFDVTAPIVERSGCDQNPLEPGCRDTELVLSAYIWAGQVERLGRLRAALDIARRVPAPLHLADAADWLEAALRGASSRTATVVFHSIVMPYLGDRGRERVREIMQQAGSRATSDAPLAWLRMEPGADQAEVHLTLWPSGEERLIATAGFHGPPVQWLG